MLSKRRNQEIIDTLYQLLGSELFFQKLEKVRSKADFDVPCSASGDTLLKAAVQDDNSRAAKALVEAGADPDCQLDGISPMQRARILNQDAIIEYMGKARRVYIASLGVTPAL